jgi:hypothetical protein
MNKFLLKNFEQSFILLSFQAIEIIANVLPIFAVISYNSALDGKDSAMVYMGFVIVFRKFCILI